MSLMILRLCYLYSEKIVAKKKSPAGLFFGYIIPPILPAGIGGIGFSAGFSASTHSVVRNIEAIEAAFSRNRALFVAPRRRSGQISLPATTTKSPFAKGGFRGNVNILYYTVYQPVLGFQSLRSRCYNKRTACKFICKGKSFYCNNSIAV